MNQQVETFEPGDVAYTIAGNKVEVQAVTTDGRYAVAPLLMWDGQDYEAEPILGATEFVDRLSKSVPTRVKVAEIAKMDEEIAGRKAELQSVRDEIAKATAERRGLVEKLKQVPVLRRIDDYIEGRFTHLVLLSRYGSDVVVKELKAALSDDGKLYSGDLRLLALLGNRSGDLSWGLNTYKDGSGDYRGVLLCQSLEEANQEASIVVAKGLEEAWRDTHKSYLEGWITSADRFGVIISPQIREWQHQRKLAAAQQARDKAKAEFDRAETALSAAAGAGS